MVSRGKAPKANVRPRVREREGTQVERKEWSYACKGAQCSLWGLLAARAVASQRGGHAWHCNNNHWASVRP